LYISTPKQINRFFIESQKPNIDDRIDDTPDTELYRAEYLTLPYSIQVT